MPLPPKSNRSGAQGSEESDAAPPALQWFLTVSIPLFLVFLGIYSFRFGLGFFTQTPETVPDDVEYDTWTGYRLAQIIALVIGALLLACFLGVCGRTVLRFVRGQRKRGR